MDLVDEEDDVLVVLQFLDDGLEALLELSAVLGAGHETSHVETDDALVGEQPGHLLFDDALGEAFDDGTLAHTGFADEDGVVLLAARKDLRESLDFVMTTHYGIEFAFLGGLCEVEAELVERRSARFGLLSLLALTGTRTLTAQRAVFFLLFFGIIIVAVAVHVVVFLVGRGLRLIVALRVTLVVVACQAMGAGIVLLAGVDVPDFGHLLVVGRVIHIVLHEQLADHAPVVLQHGQNDVLGSHVLLLHHARFKLAELHRAVTIT